MDQEKKKIIQFKNIVKKFDDQIILKGIDLDIYENEFVTLLGPSGCGKTTLFNVLKGDIALDPPLPDFHAYCSIVEQDAPLFPGSVADNICLDTPRDEKAPCRGLETGRPFPFGSKPEAAFGSRRPFRRRTPARRSGPRAHQRP